MRTLLTIILLIPTFAFSQVEMRDNLLEGFPEFYYEIVNVNSAEPGMSRLNLYIEIPYDELQFLKLENIYEAKYEISVVIFDDDGDQIDGKIWQETIQVDRYDLTNSRKHYGFTHASFHLKPNEYRISIGLMDMDSKKTSNRKSVFKLKDFQKEDLSLSDVTLTDEIGTDSLGVRSIHPQVADQIRATGTELYCYFEIYSKLENQADFKIHYQVKDYKGQSIEEQEYVRKKEDSRTMEFFRINKNKLTHGKYLIELEVAQGELKDSIKKNFVVRWKGMPTTVADLNKAIGQLKFIAKQEEIDEIKKAPEAERIEKFEKFWEKRDPTAGTPENELMDEYYRRVAYANENFSSFKEGWKSDMGMIYIIFGPPSDIERHPFDRGYKPFEIWYYYHINRQFIFVDETGFGDYRLRNPYWRNWQDDIYY